MWRSCVGACGLVLFLGCVPVLAQEDAAQRVAQAERRAADAERRAADAERRALQAGASAGGSAPGSDMQKLECQAAQRNFQVMCSRRAMETAWETRECATAAAEIHSQCAGR